MGLAYSSIFQRLPPGARVVVMGPQNAGKKTLVGRLKLQEEKIVVRMPDAFSIRAFRTPPTTVTGSGRADGVGDGPRPAEATPSVLCLDLTRKIWAKYAADLRKYYSQAECLIFVVDSSDRDSLLDAKDLLRRLLKDPSVTDSVILVLANKQDVDGALSVGSVTRLLDLEQFNSLIWRVISTSALSEQGVYEALDWMSRTIVKKAELDAD
ncbi:unnamed protein product [Amoebophrya sp. A120]|nr:unnamed protein product [Amoebophrya sp. A120]|eukprot:GSA120T00015373001.1